MVFAAISFCDSCPLLLRQRVTCALCVVDAHPRTVVAVAGKDFAVIAGDTRLSTGYSILTRHKSKLYEMYALQHVPLRGRLAAPHSIASCNGTGAWLYARFLGCAS